MPITHANPRLVRATIESGDGLPTATQHKCLCLYVVRQADASESDADSECESDESEFDLEIIGEGVTDTSVSRSAPFATAVPQDRPRGKPICDPDGACF